jgi:hypothetical protein
MTEVAALRQRMLSFYTEVTNLGEIALERLPELYREDISSYTPVENRFGMKAFKESWIKMFQDYKAFTFTDIQVLGTDLEFAFFQTMTVQMGFGDPAPMPIVTLFRADEHGKVFYQRDYWDTAASLAAMSPTLERAYRWAMGTFLAGGPYSEGNAGLPTAVADDGCYHPASEKDLIDLVHQTIIERGSLRVVGTGHSVWESIVPDGFTRTPQPGQRALMLDKYQQVVRFFPNPKKPAEMLVEVQAGCNLGFAPRLAHACPISPAAFGDAHTPNITRERSWEQSLSYALQQRGYALPDLGGISHQSVGGFLSTGSAGGTCNWSIHDAIESIRVIDGRGQVVTLSEDGPDPEWFAAVGVGLGLCGVISTVTFRCSPTYNVVGEQSTSKTREAPGLDFYGDAHDGRPDLGQFLKATDYARLMWWPQRNFDRLVVWQAKRAAPSPDFRPKPYQELGRFAVGKQLAASLVYTILGNLETPERIGEHMSQIQANERQGDFASAIQILIAALRKPEPPPDPAYNVALQERFPWLSSLVEKLLGVRQPAVTLGDTWVRVVGVLDNMLNSLVSGTLSSKLFDPLAQLLAWAVPYVIDDILSAFVSLGPKDQPVVETFQDVWYLGLPMDNGMDDLLMPTYFTELWIPFTEAGGEVNRTIAAMRKLFDADGTAQGCYKATGPFCIEIYATKGDSRFSLSAASGTKDVLRIDVFWFGYNAGDPVTEFYPQFWKALEGLDYRLHWGKFLPRPDQMPPSQLLARFPRAEEWKRARAAHDPYGIFLTEYWREHLGLPELGLRR